jgi:hypothetical protein
MLSLTAFREERGKCSRVCGRDRFLFTALSLIAVHQDELMRLVVAGCVSAHGPPSDVGVQQGITGWDKCSYTLLV